HIHPEDGACLVCNRSKRFVVKIARISACTDRYHLRLDRKRFLPYPLHVYSPGERTIRFHAIVLCVVEDARKIDRAPVRQVTAVGWFDTQEGITGLQYCEVDRCVGRRT